MDWIVFITIPVLIVCKPEFDPSATMKDILIPADAAVGSIIYRLRASDPFFDYPLKFDVLEESSVVKVDSLNCSRLNSVCQANVVLLKRLDPGRFYDFTVEVRNHKGSTSQMNCSFHATNATTPIEKIFPGAPSLLMVSESSRRNTELGTILAKGNPLKMKPVLLELWGSPEFGIYQKLISERDAQGTLILLKSLDYEKRTTYHLTVLANDPWTNIQEDTRNIMGWPILIAVIDEQDTPPIFSIAPPTTSLNPGLTVGDLILRVHAEDGDKGNPREIRYGLVPDGGQFLDFFTIDELTGEIRLAKPLSDINSIYHTGQPILVKVVAEEIRTNQDEPPSQSTTIQLAFIPPGPITNNSAAFGATEYIALLDENSASGTSLELAQATINTEPGESVILELQNNNGTFTITPSSIERSSSFKISVRNPMLLDYEERKSVQCYIVARKSSSDNYFAKARLTVILNDVNDNPPKFSQEEYHGSVLEHSSYGTNVIVVEAFDVDSGLGGKIKYSKLIGEGNDLFNIDPGSGLITVANSQKLDAETVQAVTLIVEAADEDGKGFTSTATLSIDVIDINDNKPEFEKPIYEFFVNNEKNDFLSPASIRALDKDVSPPNNQIHYEILGIPENLYLNRETGEILITKPWTESDTITLKAMAWDGGIPSLSDKCEIRIYPPENKSQKLFFIVNGRNPNKLIIEDTIHRWISADASVDKITPYESEEKSIVEATIPGSRESVTNINEINRIINRKLEETYTTGYTKDEKIIRIQESSSSNLIPLLILFFILLIFALILIILCCLHKACPFYTYLTSQKTKIMTDQGTSVKNHVAGSGIGKESKSVQAVEWFNRKEAWTADHHHEDAQTDLLRNNEPDSDSYNRMQQTIQNQKHVHQDARDHMYIREGNADILRLITRDGLHQQSIPVKSDYNYTMFNSGKDLIMQQFMEQQPEMPMPIPNPLAQLQTERELIQESLREQNALLRQLIVDRDLRLETQSLPAFTQTDHDKGTQIEPGDFHFSSREVQTDNDQTDGSDEEIAIVRERAKKRNGRKSNIHKRIRTPIEEEVEFNRRSFEADEKPTFKHTKTSELRQKRASSVRQLNELSASKLGLRREVLQEIDESLERPRKSESHLGFHRAMLKHNSSSEDSSQSHDINKLRYFSESDLTLLSSRLRPNMKQEIRSENNTDSEISTKSKMGKRKSKGISRYMEWYYNRPKHLRAEKAQDLEKKRNFMERDAYLRNKLREGSYLTHKYLENNESLAPRYRNKEGDDDSGIALSRPPIADKKSVFTIAYNDVQTKQIRPDSTISQ